MLKYNNKVLQNNEVQDIALTVSLGEKYKNKDWKYNERFVHNKLVKNNNAIPMDIECPIEDLVYLQPRFSGHSDEGYYIKTNEDLELLKIVYTKLQETFKNKLVEVSIHSDTISDDYNEFSMSLEEFLTIYSLD